MKYKNKKNQNKTFPSIKLSLNPIYIYAPNELNKINHPFIAAHFLKANRKI